MRILARKRFFQFMVFALTAAAGTSLLRAQDQQPPPADQQPKHAGASFPGPLTDGTEQSSGSASNLAPDSTPLTGVQNPTLGSPEILHSYWIPGIQWSGVIQSNSYNQTSNSGWLMNNFLVGNLSLLKAWSDSQLAIDYSGGGFFSTDSTQGNGSYQQLSLSQTFQWNRWTVQFLDEFSYLPQTSLGFGGGTGLGIPGTGGSLGPVIPGIGNGYVPNQSIYAAVGPRYSNASIAQMTYQATARGSFTFSGSYGMLNFVDPGSIDNQMTTGTAGYNYSLSRKDTIGVFYQFGSYHFSGEPNAYGNHAANFAYGRKLTGILALQAYVGPSFTIARVSMNGDTASHGINVGASLSAAIRNGGLNASYSHGITGGSGVLTGSTADQVNFGANHQLGRIWSGQLNVGYARNTPIEGFGTVSSQTFSTWNFGGGVSRPFGRNATLGIAYNATIATSSSPTCTAANCDLNETYNYVTINFQWHSRPFVLP